MNKLTQFFLVLFLACLPVTMMAQDKDDSQYMVGAVPEVDGKVAFIKEFSIPGLSETQIYERMLKWMTERLKQNENTSRVVYSDQAKGDIAGIGKEWIVFSSSALSLDRTEINYQITVACKPEKCTMEIEKIRFTYREKEHYTAEEWITDEYALNKTKTKLVRGLAKWRRKTVDFANDLFAEAAKALGAPTETPAPEPEANKKNDVNTNEPIVINQRKVVEFNTPVIPATPVTPITPIPSGSMPGYKEIAPDQIPADAIQMGTGKLVIAIGSDAFNMTMMTANAGGSLGKISGKPVVFCILSPDQPYEQIEKAETYSVRFFPNGQNQPSVVLECKKVSAPAPLEGQPRTYIGEITKAWIK